MYSFESAPRCGAKTKHNKGSPCRCPAVKGKTRCRLHGGAKGSGAPKHNHNALKNGHFTNKEKIFRADVREIIRNNNTIFKKLGGAQ